MHPFIAKTFGGLAPSYYFRQMFFSLVVGVLPLFVFYQNGFHVGIGPASLCILNMILYPYSRFVYESVVSFILGDNIFILNGFIALFFKLLTMGLCFTFGIFIAPIGLAYLYFYHSRGVC